MAEESLMKVARIKMKLSLGDIAKKMKVSPQEISAWERGVRTPCTSKLIPLSECLCISIAELVYDISAIKKERK